MSPETAMPLCPKCRRPVAAWKLDHCVYCGQTFPPDLRDGFAEPEGLKWIERPVIPPEAARQLEMMKVVPMDRGRKSRSVLMGLGLLSVPVLAVLLYMLWSVTGRVFPVWLVMMMGIGIVGYLFWSLSRATR